MGFLALRFVERRKEEDLTENGGTLLAVGVQNTLPGHRGTGLGSYSTVL